MPESTESQPNQSSDAIKAVIFDYGQVLARRPTAEEFGRMGEMFNVGPDAFYELWETSRGPYDRGDVSAEEYWLKMAAQTGSSIDGKQIEILRKVEVEIWAHPDPAMLDWLDMLHTAGIKTALLSNMPWDLIEHVRTHFKWMEDFAFKTFSAEVRLIKPDGAIYQHTLKGLGLPAAETLFLDDRETNIRAAQTLGIQAIQFRSIGQLKDDLEALGFPVLPTAAHSSSDVQSASR
jgi:putative hydrolase of the HAD superfamily